MLDADEKTLFDRDVTFLPHHCLVRWRFNQIPLFPYIYCNVYKNIIYKHIYTKSMSVCIYTRICTHTHIHTHKHYCVYVKEVRVGKDLTK